MEIVYHHHTLAGASKSMHSCSFSSSVAPSFSTASSPR